MYELEESRIERRYLKNRVKELETELAHLKSLAQDNIIELPLKSV
jgi:hypothetical protein